MASEETTDGSTDTSLAKESLFARVAAYLDASELHYVGHDDTGWFELSYGGRTGSWRTIIDVAEDPENGLNRVLVYSSYPVRVPVDARAAVAEFLLRANYGTVLANLELDFEDGEVRVKTVLDSGEQAMSDRLLENVIGINLDCADRVYAPLLGVAYGRLTPQEAAGQVAFAADEVAGSVQ